MGGGNAAECRCRVPPTRPSGGAVADDLEDVAIHLERAAIARGCAQTVMTLKRKII